MGLVKLPSIYDYWQRDGIYNYSPVLMGLVKLPSIYNYWQRDGIYNYSPVASRITRDRSFELHRFLHFADNSTLASPGTPEYNELGKVLPTSTVSQNPFNLFTLPTCECGWSNDSFQGAIHIQAIHAPETSQEGDKSMGTGRCNEWICIHVSGKQGNTAEKGLGANVVTTLTKLYTNMFRHVYLNNCWSSPWPSWVRYCPNQQEGFSLAVKAYCEEGNEGKG